ncbi:ArsR/SmtB family transcription factor [Actinomadura roseirufa]|uniref:ArsR/SmtB family transcription factor n=1 Tax=Actinomadura roseirufa TaxID=2094049 RepID=UPI0010418AA3|nr:helix-turn-helix domain-containing protein [Actinomadura roseirufa]
MGWWQISTDTLAASRFVVSPLAETVATMKALERGTAAHPGERAWLDAHLPAYRARLAADPITALLIRAALGATWNADFLTPTPSHDGEASFEEEVAAVGAVDAGTAREHLTVSLGGPVPPELDRPDLPARTADHLQWVWTHVVLPSWPRRRRIIEADIVARTAQLGRDGWAGALDDLRPGMRWLGGSRLQVNTHDYPPHDLGGAQLMFVPVTPRHGWTSWDESQRRFAAVYPCSGALAGAHIAAPEALGRLLGPARAGVLVLLDDPKSTTQLVALTGQALGSVGRHLRVLLDARLVGRRRTGRSVLYYRTETGEALVAAQRDG